MPAPVNDVVPAITGTVKVGEVLTCDNGTWTTTGNTTYTRQWKRSIDDGEYADIAGATLPTYIIAGQDLGYKLACVVTAKNNQGQASAESLPTAAVVDEPVQPDDPPIGVFVVEDGTGIVNATSLCSVEHADKYHALRNSAAWLNASLGDKQTALVAATDYIEIRWRPRLRGVIQFPETPQHLGFPRLYIGNDGAVPWDVQKATAEYALRALSAPLMPDAPQETSRPVESTRKKVGPIETETKYVAGTTVTKWQSYPVPDGLMKPFTTSGSGLVRA